MAKFGGRQPGAGRPKGSTTKPRLSDYLTEKDILAIVNTAKELALKGNEAMIKLITEQHFGKAVQPIGNDGDNAFKISGVEVTVKSANVQNQN